MSESLVAVGLLSLVQQEMRDDHARDYKKMHGERITQGTFSQVWRACHTVPDGLNTIVAIKEVTYTPESAWQEAHELECLRRLNNDRFRDHIIKLLRVLFKVWSHALTNIIVMESGITTRFHIQRSYSGLGTGTVQA